MTVLITIIAVSYTHLPVKYAASYQYTESDGMDLTYFLEYQAGVIKRALQNWQQHIDEITQRSAKLDSVLFSSCLLYTSLLIAYCAIAPSFLCVILMVTPAW